MIFSYYYSMRLFSEFVKHKIRFRRINLLWRPVKDKILYWYTAGFAFAPIPHPLLQPYGTQVGPLGEWITKYGTRK